MPHTISSIHHINFTKGLSINIKNQKALKFIILHYFLLLYIIIIIIIIVVKISLGLQIGWAHSNLPKTIPRKCWAGHERCERDSEQNNQNLVQNLGLIEVKGGKLIETHMIPWWKCVHHHHRGGFICLFCLSLTFHQRSLQLGRMLAFKPSIPAKPPFKADTSFQMKTVGQQIFLVLVFLIHLWYY